MAIFTKVIRMLDTGIVKAVYNRRADALVQLGCAEYVRQGLKTVGEIEAETSAEVVKAKDKAEARAKSKSKKAKEEGKE